MLVFRDDRRRTTAGELVRRLAPCTENYRVGESALTGLILAGMLESALADADCREASHAARITDAFAAALTGGRLTREEVMHCLDLINVAQEIEYSAPEGFAYYDVHPLQYAAAARVTTRSRSAAVIGIRSIGSTLGASVLAGLKTGGVQADRITVRPSGHPFDRRAHFGNVQQQWVNTRRDNGSHFLVVDEGPGLSGSSFLSVGDALVSSGVAHERITFLCSADPDVERLRAPNAAQRWRSFRSVVAQPKHQRWAQQDTQDWGGGLWRAHLYGDERNWPASWVQFERRKFLLQEGRVIAKFEGLGHFGRETLDRASLLAEKKFGPPVGSLGDGYAGYKRLRGRPANASELNAALLDRIAEYLAFRVGAFPADTCAADVAKMASCNLEEEFGGNVCAPRPAINSPIIADGRMLPHEWIQTARGWIKTDGANHGDDHFFPGPTDIAWDLAGAIIEWELSQDAIQYLLRRYEWLTGDAAGKRLPAWTAAYAIFRMAYCKMAAQALEGTPEQARLHMEYRRYRSRVLECCRALAA